MYQQLIQKALAAQGRSDTNPVHVEAWMRCENGTLDRLSPRDFAREVKIAADCVEHSSADVNDRLAKSYGLR